VLIILAVLFAIVTKNVSIWIILIVILGVIDIALGLYRKNN
jgi:general stress protein CsbA